MRDSARVQKVSKGLPVMVDYSASIEARLFSSPFALGPGIGPKAFPPEECWSPETVDIHLAWFGSPIPLMTVLRSIGALGFRSVTFAELLAFGTAYPNWLRECSWIMAPGSFATREGFIGVPCIDLDEVGPTLFIYWDHEANPWCGLHQIAMVCKSH